ncbi:MAG: efflux RND transporter periplasmic adaptor subunit [Thermoguttaceae bacterium]
MNAKTIRFGVGVLLLLALGYVLYNYTSSSSPEPSADQVTVAPLNKEKKVVNTAVVEEIIVNHTSKYPGMVDSFQTAKLAFRVGGPLVEIKVKPGDHVKEGDVLMQIDPRDYKNEVDSITAQLDALRARFQAMKKGAREEDIKLLEASVEAAKAKFDFADQEYQRAQQLTTGRVMTQSDFEAVQHNFIASKMGLHIAEQELAKGQIGAREEEIAATEAEIRALEVRLQVARDRLNDTSLRAPFDGIVTNRLFENYEMVEPMKEVLGLHDISKLRIRVFLPENELIRHNLSKDMEADFVFSAEPEKKYRGKVYEIDTRPRNSSSLITITNSPYAITFVIDAPTDLNLLPGMVAEAFLTDVQRTDKQLVVPSSAVLGASGDSSFVWSINAETSRALKRPIQRGPLTQHGQYIVLGGLEPGEIVITEGNRFLSDGVEVVVQE